MLENISVGHRVDNEAACVCEDYEAADSEPAASTVPHLESRIFRPLVFRDSASYQIGSEKHMDKHVNNRNVSIVNLKMISSKLFLF